VTATSALHNSIAPEIGAICELNRGEPYVKDMGAVPGCRTPS